MNYDFCPACETEVLIVDCMIHGETDRELALVRKERDEAIRALSETPYALTQRTAETLDAERYRYLRDVAAQYMDDEDGPTVCSGLGDLFEYHVGPEVDEVVDAAIAVWKAAGCPMPKEAPK